MANETQTKAKAGAIIIPVTLFEQNCTLIWCEVTRKAVVIDPGGDVPKIQAAIKQSNVSVEQDCITLSFRAKGGKHVRKECDAGRLARAIGTLKQLPGRRMFQYRNDGGEIRQVSTAQGGVASGDFDNYYIAGQMVMYPSTGTNLALAVTSVYYDSTGANPTAAWSVERGGAAAITSPTSFVSGLGTANGSTIVVQATFTFTSPLDYFITSPITITAEVAGQPRNFLPGAGYNQGIPCPPAGGGSCS